MLSVLVGVFALLGCGGGGGGSVNPAATELSSAATGSLAGTVRYNGAVLADARVFLYTYETAHIAGLANHASLRGSAVAPALRASTGFVAETTTNSQGLYTINNVPQGKYTLIAAKGNLQFSQEVTISAAMTPVDAVLTPTGSISGTVVGNKSGVTAPAAGVMVYLDGNSYVAFTDANGIFTITGVPTNRSFVLMVMPGINGLQGTPPTVTALPGQTVNAGTISLTVPVDQTGSISGTVVMSTVTSPDPKLAGAIMLLTGPEHHFSLTDNTGAYGFIVKTAGNYSVSAVHADYSVSPAAQPVTVALGATPATVSPFTMTERPGIQQTFTVSGYAVNTLNGQATIDGVNMTLSNMLDSSVTPITVVSGSDGSFSFKVPAGEYALTLGARFAFDPAASYMFIEVIDQDVVLGNVGLKPLSISLFTVSGLINKTPLAYNDLDQSGVTITITSQDAAFQPMTAVSGANGYFNFRVPAGTYALSAGSAYELVDRTSFAAFPVVGQDVALGNIAVMPTAAPLFDLTGSINKTSFALADNDQGGVVLTLTSTDPAFQPVTIVSGIDGSFAFKVPAGTYSLSAGGFYTLVTPTTVTGVSVAGPTSLAQVDVRPNEKVGATITGTVTPANLASSYVVKLEGISATYSDYESTTSGTGDFKFDGMPSGDYRVVVLPTENGYFAESAPITVVSGDLVNVNLTAADISPLVSSVTYPDVSMPHRLQVNGSNFGTAAPVARVDGQIVPAYSGFTWTNTQGELDLSSVGPGNHNLVIETSWVRASTSEVFQVKSQPFSFNRNPDAPTGLTASQITDSSARITWVNANGTRVAQISTVPALPGQPYNVDGNSFVLTGMAASANYVVTIKNTYGALQSSNAQLSLTTRSPGIANPVLSTLAGSSAIVNLATKDIFGFEMMNDKFYVAYATPVISGPTALNVNIVSYDLSGAELASYSVIAGDFPVDRFDFCAGNNSIYLTYPDVNAEQKLQALNDGLVPVGTTFSYNTVIPSVNQVKIECHGTRVFSSFFSVATMNELRVYAFDSTLANPTLVYSAQNGFAVSNGFMIQTTADEISGDLYIAVASGTAPDGSPPDNFEIIRKPLATPAVAGTQLAVVTFSSTAPMIEEFGVKGSELYVNGDMSASFFMINRSSGYYSPLNYLQNLGSLGVDQQGRLWGFQTAGGSRYLVNLDNGSVVRSIKIAQFPNVMSDIPFMANPREFAKLQKSGTAGRFGMLHITAANELAVHYYDSSF